MSKIIAKWGKSLVALLILLSVASFQSEIVFGAEDSEPPLTENPSDNIAPAAVDIANVNVQDAKLLVQDGNNFNLFFTVSNGERVQSEIIYSINLLQINKDDNLILIDQKVYHEDVIALHDNETIHKQVTYSAPSYLNGKYVIQIEAKNSNGLTFGAVQIQDEVSLVGNGEYIVNNPTTCYLTIEGEIPEKRYTPEQGVDITTDESLIVHCTMSNTFKDSQYTIPVFQTYYRSLFGNMMSEVKQDSIQIKKNQEQVLTLKVPKATEAQAYDAALFFTDMQGNRISGSIALHYVLRGESATIQNLIVDKNSYVVGDEAKGTFFWSGSADNFHGSRFSDSKKQPLVLNISLMDDSQNMCAKKYSHALDAMNSNGVEQFTLAITRNCQNSVIAAEIVSEGGKVLAQNKYSLTSSIASKNQDAPLAQESKDNTMKNIISAIAVVLVLILGRYLFKKNRTSSLKIMFAFMIGSGVFISNNHAHALTFTYNAYDVATTYTANVDKSSYAPGENINMAWTMRSHGCSNHSYEGRMEGELAGQTVSKRTGGPAGHTYTSKLQFTAPNTPGVHDIKLEACNMTMWYFFNKKIAGCTTKTLPITVEIPNRAPNPPSISGDVTPAQNVSSSYSFRATDPDGDNLLKLVYWGDGSASWAPGYYWTANGASDSTTHTWTTPGPKTVTAYAYDTSGIWSSASTKSITVSAPVAGKCGTAHGKTYPDTRTTYAPDAQCETGTSNNTAFPLYGGSQSWVCAGASGAVNSPTCTVSRDKRRVLKVCPSSISVVSGNEVSVGAYFGTGSCLDHTGDTDVTNSATWSSGNSSVATVTNSSQKGIVKGANKGLTTMNVTYSGNTITPSVTVLASTDKPLCPCSEDTAGRFCSTEAFDSTNSIGCVPQKCSGTKTDGCGSGFIEVPPTQ